MSDHNQKPGHVDELAEPTSGIWPQIRQLLIFQIKLYVDALRDILMSPLSFIVLIIDLLQGNKGDDSLFESLLGFGRKTEKAINLFNQHDIQDDEFNGIDSIITHVEKRVRKDHKDSSTSTPEQNGLDETIGKQKKNN